MLNNFELVSRLVIAAALGSVIGFERELDVVKEFREDGPRS